MVNRNKYYKILEILPPVKLQKTESVMEKSKGQIAKELFLSGYNCAQAVVIAYKDELGMDEEVLARLASSFGGGIAQLREVCGSVSGGALVLGLLKGYSEAGDLAAKRAHYKLVQSYAAKFREAAGSIVCRELLSGSGSFCTAGEPTPRTDEFYHKRPCAELIALSADILAEFVK